MCYSLILTYFNRLWITLIYLSFPIYEQIQTNLYFFDREILQHYGEGLLTIHEQLTVSRHFGDSMVRWTTMVNPLLSPKIHIQILRTDLHTFLYRISWENLIKDQSIFPLLVIIWFILVTIPLQYVLILSGESWCWSLLNLMG